MSTMKDVARIVAMRNKITVKQAEAFVNQFVDTLKVGLNNEGIVKIKGLGTFKLMKVRERESIDVNTGKRVIIGSHDRITFTPDNTMKDSVNKPFSHFETVILNDGVSFEDTPDENETEISEEEPEEAVAPKVKEAPKPVKKAPVAPIQPKPVEEPEPEEDDEEEEEESQIHWKEIIMVFFCCVICLVAGFFIGRETVGMNIFESLTTTEQTTPSEVQKKDSVKVQHKDSTKVQQKDSTKVQASDTPATNYNKDPRYRLGAYIITGTKCTHTVKAGQTLKGIAKAYLGPDMEVYVEVLNGGIKEVKPGQKINIPTLKLKKSGKRGSTA